MCFEHVSFVGAGTFVPQFSGNGIWHHLLWWLIAIETIRVEFVSIILTSNKWKRTDVKQGVTTSGRWVAFHKIFLGDLFLWTEQLHENTWKNPKPVMSPGHKESATCIFEFLMGRCSLFHAIQSSCGSNTNTAHSFWHLGWKLNNFKENVKSKPLSSQNLSVVFVALNLGMSMQCARYQHIRRIKQENISLLASLTDCMRFGNLNAWFRGVCAWYHMENIQRKLCPLGDKNNWEHLRKRNEKTSRNVFFGDLFAFVKNVAFKR